MQPRPTGRGGLRISRAVHRRFDGRSAASLDPDLRRFAADQARPYGLALREDLLSEGVGHTYAEMGEALLDDLALTGDRLTEDRPADLLLLAFDVPDVQPGLANTLRLSRACPGQPLAFAIGDQGPLSPFTALRIADRYARTGACERALVLLLEQPALHYRPPGPVELPEHAEGVLLLCEQTDDTRTLTVDQSESAPRPAPAPGPEAWRSSWPYPEPPPPADATTGQPLTGAWTAVLAGWHGEGPLLVRGTDRRTGRTAELHQP
ncbi:hypothetical protein ACIRBX_02155 [Kitasatospora sp. NPDC096147]|uniref:hypothetical protein n=1 Tax=Kitasatospora sp. NPDC096147 TaxID=3364093 RepID=UPI0037F99E92